MLLGGEWLKLLVSQERLLDRIGDSLGSHGCDGEECVRLVCLGTWCRDAAGAWMECGWI